MNFLEAAKDVLKNNAVYARNNKDIFIKARADGRLIFFTSSMGRLTEDQSIVLFDLEADWTLVEDKSLSDKYIGHYIEGSDAISYPHEDVKEHLKKFREKFRNDGCRMIDYDNWSKEVFGDDLL